MAVLEFLNGDRAGERLTLVGERAVLGRHPECDIVLNVGAVSRQHAQISLVDGQYVIEDLHSRNGTLVNGELVHTPQALRDGDEVKICDLALEFHADSARGVTADYSASSADGKNGSGPQFAFDESEGQGTSTSTVMLKLDVTSTREASRLAVNPETKLRAGRDHAKSESGYGHRSNLAEGA